MFPNKVINFFLILLVTFLIGCLANTQNIGYWKLINKVEFLPNEPRPICCLDSYYAYLNPIFWLPHVFPLDKINDLIIHGKNLYTPFKVYLGGIYSSDLPQKPLDTFAKPCILSLNCLNSFPITDIKNIQFYFPLDGSEILFWLFIIYWFILTLIITKLIKKFFYRS
jgi:hypothetical protein